MGVEIIFKIAAVGLITAIVSQVLQHAGKNEIATLTTLAGLIVVLYMVMDMVGSLFESMKMIFTMYQYDF